MIVVKGLVLDLRVENHVVKERADGMFGLYSNVITNQGTE